MFFRASQIPGREKVSKYPDLMIFLPVKAYPSDSQYARQAWPPVTPPGLNVWYERVFTLVPQIALMPSPHARHSRPPLSGDVMYF